MRDYCEQAKHFGQIRAPISTKLKKVLVILNPAANKRNAEDDFNAYCAPILNLAGYFIDVVKTQNELHAIRYTEEELHEQYDAIIVAGGDGTISEAITGLLRRNDELTNCPIGVIPLGQHNMFSLTFLKSNATLEDKVEAVKVKADAALAIVKGNVKKQDIMRIELVSDEQDSKKVFYAVGSIFWGSFNDIIRKKDKYWITGSLRSYTACLFNGAFPRTGITWDCTAKLIYSASCDGCSNCYEKIESNSQKLHKSRWWSKFNANKEVVPEYSKVLNPKCLETTEMEVNASELAIATNVADGKSGDKSKLNIKISNKNSNYGLNYIWNAWKRVSEKSFLDIPDSTVLESRQVMLIPNETEAESFFSIDFNVFEAKPVKVTILPNRLNFFTP